MHYSNLHTHTTFSDGAHTLEENILSALEKGMVSLGFSEHSYTPCDDTYCMQRERYGEYLESIARLKKKYAGQLPIYAGVELDAYFDGDHSAFDYTIAAVHYIIKDGVCYPIDHSREMQEQCIAQGFGGDVLAMAQSYFDLLAEHVARVRPTLVGHFDVVTKFSLMPEGDARYRKIAETAMRQILQYCKYIELNTGAIARGWRKTPYPADYLLDTIRDHGGEIVLGSDCHHKDYLTYYFDEAAALLKQKGFDHINVFTGSGFDRQPI